MTKIFQGVPRARAIKNVYLAIGNFDGVHLGHQALLKSLMRTAKDQPTMVMTFEPQPKEFFSRNDPPARLTTLREKYRAVAALGIDYLYVLKFNKKLAEMSAETFIDEILMPLSPNLLFIGHDFRFGYKRLGNAEMLQRSGISVKSLETYEVYGQKVSSTRVREALQLGDFNTAKTLLGRPYSMLGRVVTGDQRGRLLGFKTANMPIKRLKSPISGVFVVLLHGLTPNPQRGVANVGVRPTVDGTKSLLEVHLLDFHQDFYGQELEVEFLTKLRDEKRFESLEKLKEQLAIDIAAAQHHFEQQGMS